ncbi:GntR family transcriptional regulator [Streptomyces sp. NBC_00663]|uniref:GntR family transcriptional regulator n=1 Tax=Streptomyces sp. NBC_00663 TaxID=2975801 RepID=UPI002E327B1D|nr:GntR family transcriptional regulator [Streptomyces sp. NBC_00663]
MPQQANPRGTFMKIADSLKRQIEGDPGVTELPALADVMRDHDVSRGVALRAFGVLRQEGVAEPAPGGRWRVVRAGAQVDRRPLDQQLADIITAEGLEVGEAFPSASALAVRFGVSRPTVAKALSKLETAGVLADGGQGKVRRVRAVPTREERS